MTSLQAFDRYVIFLFLAGGARKFDQPLPVLPVPFVKRLYLYKSSFPVVFLGIQPGEQLGVIDVLRLFIDPSDQGLLGLLQLLGIGSQQLQQGGLDLFNAADLSGSPSSRAFTPFSVSPVAKPCAGCRT